MTNHELEVQTPGFVFDCSTLPPLLLHNGTNVLADCALVWSRLLSKADHHYQIQKLKSGNTTVQKCSGKLTHE